MENKNCGKCENCNEVELIFADVTLDDGRTFHYEYYEGECEFLIKEPFILAKEDDEIVAMFNMNNVVSVIFD